MFVEHSFFVGFRDVDYKNNLKIKSALSYLEDVAGIHSNIAGFGLLDIEKNKKTWVLINWKLEFIRRPKYSENGEIIAKATSKWVLIDLETMGITKPTDLIMKLYTTEPDKVFETKLEKLKEPKDYISSSKIKITKDMIDANGHVHNINYIDFATQVMPLEVMQNAKKVEVLYKKEIRDVENIKAFYGKEDEKNFCVIKSEDEQIVHAIIKMNI